jgi:hypothetical protein
VVGKLCKVMGGKYVVHSFIDCFGREFVHSSVRSSMGPTYHHGEEGEGKEVGVGKEEAVDLMDKVRTLNIITNIGNRWAINLVSLGTLTNK